MKITIQPYSPTWTLEFQSAKSTLTQILSSVPYTSIEHVGSTSIPDLPAKPVLDIDIIVPLGVLPAARAALSSAGYTDQGEMGIPGRFQFRQPGFGANEPAHGERGRDGKMRRNTYVMIEGSASLRNHLDVRRVLLEDKQLRDEYGRVKMGLAGREFGTMGDYGQEKTTVLRKILRKAGWEEGELPVGKD